MHTRRRLRRFIVSAALMGGAAHGQSTLIQNPPDNTPSATASGPSMATTLFAPPTPGPHHKAASGDAQPGAATSGSTHFRVSQPGSNDVLHVMAGHSLVLHGTVPMKRVYVGDPKVLSSFNSSPNDLLVTAKEPGVTSLAIWDQNGGSQVYTISVDVDPTELQSAVDGMYPGGGIQVSGMADRLELNGVVPTQEIADGLGKLGSSYSKQVANALRVMPVMPRQVELKLQIIEVDRTKLDQFAVNFSQSGKTPVSTSTGQFASPLNLSIGYLKESINLNIQALAQQSALQILAEPTLTTLSGGTAKFLSGGEFPIPVAQAASATGGTASNAITIQFRPYGVKVDFLPVVQADNTIRLKVAPEVSTLDYGNAVTISGFTIPALSTRRADTEIQLKNGQSFVLSGLLDHRTIESLARVPGISRVPILGELFKSRNQTHTVTELVFVVTANIVDPLADAPPIVRPEPSSPFMTKEQFDRARNKQDDK